MVQQPADSLLSVGRCTISSRRSPKQWLELCEGRAQRVVGRGLRGRCLGHPRTLNGWRRTLRLPNDEPERKWSQSWSFVELFAATEPLESRVTVGVGALAIEGSDWPLALCVAEFVGRC